MMLPVAERAQTAATRSRPRTVSQDPNLARLRTSKKLAAIFNGNTLTVDRSTNHPRDTALSKITWAAASHNPRTAGFALLKGFQQGEMTPSQFREQLKRTFGILLSPEEVLTTIIAPINILTHSILA